MYRDKLLVMVRSAGSEGGTDGDRGGMFVIVVLIVVVVVVVVVSQSAISSSDGMKGKIPPLFSLVIVAAQGASFAW